MVLKMGTNRIILAHKRKLGNVPCERVVQRRSTRLNEHVPDVFCIIHLRRQELCGLASDTPMNTYPTSIHAHWDDSSVRGG